MLFFECEDPDQTLYNVASDQGLVFVQMSGAALTYGTGFFKILMCSVAFAQSDKSLPCLHDDILGP